MKEGSHGRNKYGSGASLLWLGFRPNVENVVVVHLMVGKFLHGLNQNLFTVTRQEGKTLLGCRRPKLKVNWFACKIQWKSDHESASEIWWETDYGVTLELCGHKHRQCLLHMLLAATWQKHEEVNAGTRKENRFLLQQPSSTLFWNIATLCQLQERNNYMVQLYFRIADNEGWIWSWETINW